MAPTLRSTPELGCRGVSQAGTPKQPGFLRNGIREACVCVAVDDVQLGEEAGNGSELEVGRGRAAAFVFPTVGGDSRNQMLRHGKLLVSGSSHVSQPMAPTALCHR